MIAWLSTHYPPTEVGGSGESVRLAAEALARHEDLCVLTPRWDRALPAWDHVGGVRIYRYDVEAAWPVSSERFFLSRSWRLATAQAVAHVNGVDKIRLLHAQDRRCLRGASVAARALGVPWLVTLRDVALCCPITTCLLTSPTIPADCGQVKLWLQCAGEYRARYPHPGSATALKLRLAYRYAVLGRDRKSARRADIVAFVSEGLRHVYAMAGWPGPGVRTAILPSPVSDALPVSDEDAALLRKRHGIGPEAHMVLFVGKPSPGKGWPLFAAAARATPGVYFVHVGPPPPSTSPAVFHVGSLPRPDVLTWMRAATLVCVPPATPDALPRVALEALSQGRPVVATPAGGLLEIVREGITGWLAPAERYTATLQRVLKDAQGLRYATSRARVEVLARFGPGPTTERVLEVYRGVAVECGEPSALRGEPREDSMTEAARANGGTNEYQA